MACRTLLGKRAQRDLLAAACAQHALATVEPWTGRGVTVTGRLGTIEADRLTLCWEDAKGAATLAGEAVEVHFAHDGRFYLVCGVLERGSTERDAGDTGTLIRLSGTARFDLNDRRRDARFNLLGRTPAIRVIFVKAGAPRARFCGRLADISEGGVSVIVAVDELPDIMPSDSYQLRIASDEEPGEATVQVRVAYLRPGNEDGTAHLGWFFHANADRSQRSRVLRRLLALARETVPARTHESGGRRSTTHATGH